MKRLVLGSVAIVLTTSGLIAAPVSSAIGDHPYGTDRDLPPEVLAVATPQAVGERSVVRAKVVSPGATVRPPGRAVLSVAGKSGAAAEQDVVLVRRETFNDNGRVRFTVRCPEAGRYRFVVEYRADPGSSFADSSTAGSFRVPKN